MLEPRDSGWMGGQDLIGFAISRSAGMVLSFIGKLWILDYNDDIPLLLGYYLGIILNFRHYFWGAML